MVLDRQRRLFDFFLVPLGRGLGHVNPNVLTLLGLLAAIPAGVLFYLSRPETETRNSYLVFAALFVAKKLHAEKQGGCVVTILCDRGDRYFAPMKWEKRYVW